MINKLLNLDYPLVIFDVETTGLNKEKDRIVQIALRKIYPDGRTRDWSSLINPEQHITHENSKIHGITDDMVENEPIFSDVASTLLKGFNNCYIGGFNVKFDVGFINYEFKRINCNDFKPGKLIDAGKIFWHYNPRNLSAACEFYLKEKHTNAHNAIDDVDITTRILEKQLEFHHDLSHNIHELHHIFFETPDEGYADVNKKIKFEDGVKILNFGNKYKGYKLSDIPVSYLDWILKSDFHDHTKKIIKQELERRK